jgi:NTE family protein
MKRALVLGGGGSYGIAWESGLLVGLAEAGVDVRNADLIVGTSAGSQVGTVVASGLSWDEIWGRQVDPLLKSRYVAGSIDMSALFQRTAQIQSEAKSPEDWLRKWSAFALESTPASRVDRLQEIEQRLQLPLKSPWPERLGVVAVECPSGKRAVWSSRSGVDLIRAVASSSALPGVYPAVTIGDHQYCDGGIHSMENADLAEGYDKVLVLCVGIGIPAPYTLEQQVESLRRSGSEVEVLQPDQGVLTAYRQAGGNSLNPEIRAPVAQAAKAQGLDLSKKLSAFWNGRG